MTLPPDEPVIVDGGDRACAGLLPELRARIAGLPGGRYALRTISAPAATDPASLWRHRS